MKCLNCGSEELPCMCLKKPFRFLIGGLVLLLLVLALIGTFRGVKSLGNITNSNRIITVTGKGEVEAKPDVANISFSLIEINNSSDSSKNSDLEKKISEKVSTIVKSLKDLGIEEKDIKTENYNVNPNYGYISCSSAFSPCGATTKISSYTISENISVKVRNTENASKVLAILSQNGVSQVDGPNFTIDDKDKLITEARDKAIADAKSKARILSRSLGVDLDKIVSYSDSSNEGGYPMLYKASGSMVTDSSATPSIESGSQKIISNVTISFEIED